MTVCLSTDNEPTCKCSSKTSENFKDISDVIVFFSPKHRLSVKAAI